VEGVKEMVQRIYDDHKGFSVIVNYLLSYALLQSTAYLALILAYARQELSGITLAFLLIISAVESGHAVRGRQRIWAQFTSQCVMVAALGLAAYYGNPLVPVASLLAVFTLT
jgi:hypothetical protein